MEKYEKIEKKLDSVSSSFCLAKWLQVTIDLHNGETQSCHHPDRHKIPLEEVKKDPSALHNTLYKMELRKMMLEGGRPSECVYCWNVEDASENSLSDRLVKSSDDWAFPYFEDVASAPWNAMVAPTYLEVMFSNQCQLTCSYCNGAISSSIKKEIEKEGSYPLQKHVFREDYRSPLTSEERDVYIRAFWRWFPQIYEKLHVLRVTGGEPFLDDNTFKVMEHIKRNHNDQLRFAVNSNLSLPSSLMERSFKSLIEVQNKTSGVELYVSLDAVGERAKYIRSGLNMELLNDNIRRLRAFGEETQIIFMCTYSILSMDGFPDFLQYVLDMKKRFGNILLDVAYLQSPDYLSFKIAMETQIEDLKKSVALMKENYDETGDRGFNDAEIRKVERLYHYSKIPLGEKDRAHRLMSFYKFVEEYDRRKSLDFDKTFPGLVNLKKLGKKFFETLA